MITGTTTICLGKNTTLSVSGGSLGTGASWRWYSGSCGGTSVGTGSSLNITGFSAGTTTYFVRAEGTCNNTVCRNVTVTVLDSSAPAISITGNTIICQGQTTTLSVNGGSLGSAASWRWYSGSCGGTSVGAGSSISLTPVATTTYFVRAEGTCNTTICRSLTITVRDSSIAASSISGTTTICLGQSTTLNAVGGRLGHNASWKWYTGSCGGTLVNTGSSLNIVGNTAGTFTYFLRAEGTCNNTICQSVTLTVRDSSTQAVSITGPDTVCLGTKFTWRRNGGSLGTNAVWQWYNGACGNIPGVSAPVAVGDSLTNLWRNGKGRYTYFLRAEGVCNTTPCVSKTLVIVDTSIAPNNFTENNPICLGQSYTLNIGRTGSGLLGYKGVWRWYSTSCGVGLVGTGATAVVAPTAAGTYTYFVRAEAGCNTTKCATFTITVLDTNRPATSISGTSVVCRGTGAVTLRRVGGSLGSSGRWQWWNGACGNIPGSSSPTGTGDSLRLNINGLATGNHTYYLRAEGGCNTTSCVSFTLTVRDTSLPASSITGISTICLGESTVLTVNGGSLGTGANWRWYSASCGITAAGTGAGITVTPTAPGTYNYFVRAEGGCNTTACRSFTLTVRDTSTAPTAANASSTNICRGQSTTLSVVGGNLGSGSNWRWYSGSCGGIAVGTGPVINVSPLDTTIYFVRAEGPCGVTSCRLVKVDVVQPPVDAKLVTSNYDEVCAGTYVKLYAFGPALKTGETRRWYLIKGPNLTPVGTGDSIAINGSNTMDILVRTENACFNSTGITKRINVLNFGAGTWVGVKSTDWHDSINWCSGVPTSTTDVTIPAGTKYRPVITATAFAKSLTISSGTDLTVNSKGTLELYGSFVKNGNFTSNGTVVFASGGTETTDGFNTKHLRVNTGGVMNLNADVKVTGTLKMIAGKVKTNSSILHVTNRDASAVVADATNPNFLNSWVDGRLKRDIQTIDSLYHFPVGSVTTSNNLEFYNHNVGGSTSLVASFGPKPGIDTGLTVSENGTDYARVLNGGVWYLTPDNMLMGGNFDLRLWFHSQPGFVTGLIDNTFSILRRDESSLIARDWKLPQNASKYVVGLVSNGYVDRTNVEIFGQFGIGQTQYGVSTKPVVSNNEVRIYPNPTTDKFKVDLNLSKPMNTAVKVYDQSGRLVRNIAFGKQSGKSALEVDLGDVSEGTYIVVVEGDGNAVNKTKLVKLTK